MKKTILQFLIVLTLAICNSISAQVQPSAVTGDKDLRDENIRMRSIDLERAKRDAEKPSTNTASATLTAAPAAVIKSDIETKYPQIKEDFEGIQINQAVIIKAYTTGEKIDYMQIKTSAADINSRAKRLDENLFAPKVEVEEKEEQLKETKTKSIRQLIVELDNAIGNLVSSPMFQNLRVTEPESAGKTQANLAKIIEISEFLLKETGKMK
ncbi:MAG: hypothetical protein ABIP06_07980 [Pyrinomonadaceae bacterium]